MNGEATILRGPRVSGHEDQIYEIELPMQRSSFEKVPEATPSELSTSYTLHSASAITQDQKASEVRVDYNSVLGSSMKASRIFYPPETLQSEAIRSSFITNPASSTVHAEQSPDKRPSYASVEALVQTLQKEKMALKIELENETFRRRMLEIENVNLKMASDINAVDAVMLQESYEKLCEKTEAIAEQRDSLRVQIENRKDYEAQLKDAVNRLDEGLGASKQEIQTMKILVQLAEEKCSYLAIFAELGALIRSRLLEWAGPYKQHGSSLIDTGNRAAHYGSALSDALLYTPQVAMISPTLQQRTDEESYMKLYGVKPAMMLKYKHIQPLIEIFNMRATMKRFLVAASYDTTQFKHHYDEALELMRSRADQSIQGLENLFLGEDMAKHLNAMRIQYEEAAAKDKEKRKRGFKFQK